jgi:peptidoglycan hydrolase CwlO-like protein
MKYYKQALALLALLVFFSTSVIAQEEISTDEWEAEIARLTEEKASLTQQIEGLQSEVNALAEKKNSLQAFEDCQNEMYALVGADAMQLQIIVLKLMH